MTQLENVDTILYKVLHGAKLSICQLRPIAVLLAIMLLMGDPVFANKGVEGEGSTGSTPQDAVDAWVEESGTPEQKQQWEDIKEHGVAPVDEDVFKWLSSFVFKDIPLTGSKVTSGYVMTHEHPTAGMAFGGNYAYAGASGNYQNGIPDRGYTSVCSGCDSISKCDHGVVKGILIERSLNPDMGNHSSLGSPQYDSFSHLRYSSEWIEDAYKPVGQFADNQMKIMLAFAVENEGMCELLYYANKGGGGPGGSGWPCSKGDSVKSLERQIINLKNWAKANHDWVEIAYTAAQARSIVNSNKMAVVLGIEADYAWGAEDRNFDPVSRLDRYYDDGVRTFYMAHKVNSRLAGADIFHDKNSTAGRQIRTMQAISGCFYYDDNIAPFPLIATNILGKKHNFCDNNCGHNYIKGSAIIDSCNNKISSISALNMLLWSDMGNDEFNGFAIYPRPPGFSDSSGGSHMDGDIERNNLSLSKDGSRITLEAMRRGMIMNLGHVSSKARIDIYNHSQEYYNYPVNALHNNPNEMLILTSEPEPATPGPNEYDIDKKERNYIKDSGGIFGVRLGPINAKAYDASGVKGENANCSKTSTENAKVLAYLIDEGQRVGYSLDFASITEGTHSRTKEGCQSLGKDYLNIYNGSYITHGLGHIGNMKSWHRELEEIGMHKKYVNVLKNKGAEHFLRMWEKSEFIANMPATIMGLL